MAKGSAMGLWKGKKGSSVFYQISNSNSLQKQGIRERNYEPANPQSAGQAGQRMRMYPAQAVYGVLKDTIERSWQGVKYGQMTRQAYLKAALKSEYFPAVSKGDGVIVPGPYQIAKGSLGEVEATLTEQGAAYLGFSMADSGSATSTIGDLSQALLDANPWLKEGDQITVVLCYTGDSTVVRFNWWVGSIYIDPQNDTELEVVDPEFVPLGFDIAYNGNGIVYTPVDDGFIYAAAAIVSREGTTPMRSNAKLSVNAAALPDYYGSAAIARAKRSYMKPVSVRSTDWPVDPSADGGDDSITITVNQVTQNESGTEIQLVGGTVSGGGTYLEGEQVNLVATANSGYTFVGWYPSKNDAMAGSNRISNAAVFVFNAGDSAVTSSTIYGLFRQTV